MTLIERRAAWWALALALAPALSRAQVRDDDARRRQLILQAGALRDQGDHEGALERLRQAAARRMSPSLRLFIAQEERSLGRTLDALHSARQCADEFEADPSLPHRDEFMASCRAIADALGARVSRLVVRVPPEATGATVGLRGAPLPRSAWGVAQEVPAGSALVEAAAPGRVPFSREVTLAPGATVTVRVELPLRATDAVLAPRPRAVEASRSASDGPWVLLGAAGASFIASGVFYALRNDAIGARDGLCRASSGQCVVASVDVAREAADHQDSASTYNALTNVAIGVGAAAAVGGVVWWLVGAAARPARATAVIAPSRDGLFVGLGGAL